MYRTIFIIFLILIIFPMNSFSGDAGKTGLSFLKIDVDSRAAAMGGAYTAIASGAAASYWNPAGLASASGKNVILMHQVWIDDITHEFGAVQFAAGKHNLAVSANLMIFPGIEIREQATEDPDGISDAVNFCAAISYAQNVSKNWQAGISAKYIFEKYYLEQASGWAVDFGVRRLNLIDKFDWGFVLQNLGKMNALQKTETELPIIIRSGLVYHLPFTVLAGGHLLSADLQYVKDEQLYIRGGSQWNFTDYFNLRAGLNWYSDKLHFSTGMGFFYKKFNVDYAFIPLIDHLENSHQFSIGFFF